MLMPKDSIIHVEQFKGAAPQQDYQCLALAQENISGGDMFPICESL